MGVIWPLALSFKGLFLVIYFVVKHILTKTYNYPNPVEEGFTTFRVTVGNADKIIINIYDIAGFFIDRMQIPEVKTNDVNELIWDVRDLESGVYIANIKASFGSKSKNKILKIAVIN